MPPKFMLQQADRAGFIRREDHLEDSHSFDRRGFMKGIGAAGLLLAPAGQAVARPLNEKEKLARIASNTWPLRFIFKSRTGFGRNPNAEAQKKKYGEITMLDFPQFTKDTFPGVTHMDLFSGLFGDVADDSMYVEGPSHGGPATRVSREFDPSSASGKKWLGKLADEDGCHRYEVPAHFQQRPARYQRSRPRKAQSRGRSREEVARWREDPRREIDARQQRRSPHRSPAGGHDGLPQGR